MTTLIRKASPADLLAALPLLVGIEPRNSVVLIGFRGKRTCAAMRFDIGVDTEAVVGMFARVPNLDAVVPVICSDEPDGTHAELLVALLGHLDSTGLEIRDALSIGSDGWSSYFEPGTLRPLADIAEAARKRSLEPPPEVPLIVPPADDVARHRMRADLATLRDAADDPQRLEEFEPLADLPFLAEKALSWDEAELSEYGALLLFALQGPPVRDLVMLQWAYDLDLGDAMWKADTCIGIHARNVYKDVDAEAAERMLGNGPRPNPLRVELAISLLTTLIARAENPERRAPLCMLAWLNWALGRGTVAGRHIDEVRGIDPEYGMAELLEGMFTMKAIPGWAFVED